MLYKHFSESTNKFLVSAYKRYSRHGFDTFIHKELSNLKADSRVLSVGGYGEIDKILVELSNKLNFELLTLDINPDYKPDICKDIKDLSLSDIKNNAPDFIVIMDVLEHVEDVELGINALQSILKPNSKVIGSVPWIVPIHNYPSDFRRLTPMGLVKLFNNFLSIEIIARGNFFNSIILLSMRGVFSHIFIERVIGLIGLILSFLTKKPKLYEIKNDSIPTASMGYFFVLKV